MYAQLKKRNPYLIYWLPQIQDQALQATCLSQGQQDIAWPITKKGVFFWIVVEYFWSRKFPRSLLLRCACSLGEKGILPFMF